MADPSDCSPEVPTPVSLRVVLVRAGIPPLESRVSGSKQNFEGLPFKRVSTSPAISLWQTETPLHITSACYVNPFLNSGAPGWGSRPGI